MEPNPSLQAQLDRLLGRVEWLQQAVAQVYVELQAVRAAATPDSPSVADGIPLAQPISGTNLGPRAADRRASPRRQANQILIGISCALDDSEPFTGWVLDYSRGGLGLFADKRLAVGSFLHIKPNSAAAHAVSKEVQVMNCQRYLDGWRLGCKVEETLSPADLKQFGLE